MLLSSLEDPEDYEDDSHDEEDRRSYTEYASKRWIDEEEDERAES